MLTILLLALLTLATGCTSSGDEASSADVESAASGGELDRGVEAPAADEASGEAGQGGRGADAVQVPQQLVRTAVVSLASDDVSDTRAEVQQVVDVHGGQVSEEETGTDDDGSVARSRLVIRVPVADFTQALAELEEVAALVSTTSATEDVTTQVIDLDARIRAQRASLKRVEAMLGEAGELNELFQVESELTRRQSELDSLEQQRAYLGDQASYSTITVHLERTSQEPEEPAADGFWAAFRSGLDGGWTALVAVATAAATTVGALLPFALAGLLVGVPGWLLLRRRLRRATARAHG